MRWPRLSLVLLVAASLHGQTADLQPLLYSSSTPYYSSSPFGGPPTKLGLDVINWGPNRATDIDVTWDVDTPSPSIADPRCHVDGTRVRCRIAALEPMQAAVFAHTVTFDRPSVQLTASVTSATPDPAAFNNSATLPLSPATDKDVTGRIVMPERTFDDAVTILYEITNRSRYAGTVRVRIRVDYNANVAGVDGGTCRIFGNDVVCTLQVVPRVTETIAVDVLLGVSRIVSTTLDANWVEDFGHGSFTSRQRVYPRLFVVATDADGGEGTLRQAIRNANIRCAEGEPCRIEFADWYVIRPLTPLPRITAPVITLEGGASLDGSALAEGNGLTFDGGDVKVLRLSIKHFPGSGIHVANGRAEISNNRLYGNDRGVAIDDGHVYVRSNEITNNRRSGIFASRAGTLVGTSNTIEANGASGIFIAEAGGLASQIDFEHNVIWRNAHFGIAFHPGVHAFIGRNTIADNGYGGVDIGLDGPTPGPPAPAPRVDRAHFDGTQTIIEGIAPARATLGGNEVWYEVLLYANGRPDPQGSRYLGTATPDDSGFFTFRFDGDLRGWFVNGMATQFTSYSGEFTRPRSSEFGPTVPVTP